MYVLVHPIHAGIIRYNDFAPGLGTPPPSFLTKQRLMQPIKPRRVGGQVEVQDVCGAALGPRFESQTSCYSA